LNKRTLLPVAFLVCLTFLFNLPAQDDLKPWEKYGLSQTEWKMILDNKIPLKKVEELLKSGISVSEYIDKPWIKFKLSESAYIAKRRSGMSAYDIELERTTDRGSLKDANKGTFTSEAKPLSGSKDLALSFVLPGYEQHRLKHKTRSRIMIALAAGSVAGSLYLSVRAKTIDATPLFVILVPDMFWSMLDYKFSRENSEEE
jgi:hypothetical protein